MNKGIEKIKKQFEQGNRWVEANTDDIKIALGELGYRLSPGNKRELDPLPRFDKVYYQGLKNMNEGEQTGKDCPYPATVTDECTGQVFPDNRYVAWQEGYAAGYRLSPGDKREVLREILFDDLVLCGFTHENPPPHKDCGDECGVGLDDQIAASNPVTAPMRSGGKKHRKCMDCWNEYVDGLADQILSLFNTELLRVDLERTKEE